MKLSSNSSAAEFSSQQLIKIIANSVPLKGSIMNKVERKAVIFGDECKVQLDHHVRLRFYKEEKNKHQSSKQSTI